MLFITIVTKKITINSIVFINKKNNKYCENRKIKKNKFRRRFVNETKKIDQDT